MDVRIQMEDTGGKGYHSVTEQNAAEKARQEELKQRLKGKYASRPLAEREVKTGSAVEPDILRRASENAEEDFKKKQEIPAEADGYRVQEEIVKAANDVAEIDFYRIYDIPVMQQSSELMAHVSDIMAKGMDAKLTFERDFISEGIELMSRITT